MSKRPLQHAERVYSPAAILPAESVAEFLHAKADRYPNPELHLSVTDLLIVNMILDDDHGVWVRSPEKPESTGGRLNLVLRPSRLSPTKVEFTDETFGRGRIGASVLTVAGMEMSGVEMLQQPELPGEELEGLLDALGRGRPRAIPGTIRFIREAHTAETDYHSVDFMVHTQSFVKTTPQA